MRLKELVTAEDLLLYLETHPAGLTRDEIHEQISGRLPLGLVTGLMDRGQLIAVGQYEGDNSLGLWIYKYRLSVDEFLRRARERQHAEQAATSDDDTEPFGSTSAASSRANSD